MLFNGGLMLKIFFSKTCPEHSSRDFGKLSRAAQAEGRGRRNSGIVSESGG
jgi:hypothetical protein